MKNRTFTLEVSWDFAPSRPENARDPVLRQHTIRHPGKPDIPGSAAPGFHGDETRWNPEELLLAALSQCHMLTFFYVARQAGLVVTSYRDTAQATLAAHPDGSGNITEVMLRPAVSVEAGFDGDVGGLHQQANELCFIARSVNFPVRHDPPALTIT